MREILFRGKDIRGNWHIGLLAHIGNAWYISNKAGIATAFEVIPNTIGQYTGLTDKNGKKIFEGDVLHCTARLDSADMVVIYENAEFRLVPRERYKAYTTGMGYRYFGYLDTEVIGNIHDNPELLEVEE